MTSTSISNSVVAVTGGAHGIGCAVAEHFARAGARVAIGDVDAEAAQSLAAEIGGGRAMGTHGLAPSLLTMSTMVSCCN